MQGESHCSRNYEIDKANKISSQKQPPVVEITRMLVLRYKNLMGYNTITL